MRDAICILAVLVAGGLLGTLWLIRQGRRASLVHEFRVIDLLRDPGETTSKRQYYIEAAVGGVATAIGAFLLFRLLM